MKNKTKPLLISMVLISVLIVGIGVVAGNDGPSEKDLEGNNAFEKVEIGDMTIYWQQRMIDGAIVEGDFIVYQFDKDTHELLKETGHWRDDIPITTTTESTKLITKEQAEYMVKGEVQFTQLYIISPESVVFRLDQTPQNPCWVVRSVDNGKMIVTIIDAVEGKILGYGVPPPQITGFSLSGPQYHTPCDGVWTAWYQNAESWFNTMGYPTEAVVWPIEAKVQSHIQSTETAMFYELAHGGSYSFASGCIGGNTYEHTTPSEIETWIAGYTKMPFTFIGSCGGMCDTTDNTLSYEFRKGSTSNTVTVGYCGMATLHCDTCWGQSLNWQTALFDYMEDGDTVKDAFDQALADHPMCAAAPSCMRFAGDENLKVVPVVTRGELPVAVAGPDQTVEQDSLGGASVTLDGSGSYDPDGGSLTYIWTWDGESETGVNPTIWLPLGTTTISLTVNDGEDSAPDTVDITVVDDTPPVITCPPDVTVEQATPDGTEVSLTATATDICDADVDITSDELAIYPLGTTTVTFTAIDDSGNSASCLMTVTVVDDTPPVITCPADVTVEQATAAGTVVPLTATATDICDADPTITSDELAIYPLGSTVVTFTATDDTGNTASCTTTVTVEDTTAPDISVTVSPDLLWPPNHKMVDIVAVVTVSDICDAAPAVVLTSITSDEPDNAIGDGDGNTINDIQGTTGTDDYEFQLRAERAGTGDGRVYTITYTVTDASGNSADGSATVVVPHDMD